MSSVPGREPPLNGLEGQNVLVLVTENPDPCSTPKECKTPRVCETQATLYVIMDKIGRASQQVALRVREVRLGLPILTDTVIKMPVRETPEPEPVLPSIDTVIAPKPAPKAGLSDGLAILHKQRLEQWDRHFAGSSSTSKATPFLDLHRSTTVAGANTLVTIWEACSGASLESLMDACKWDDLEIPAAMGAIIAVDMLTAIIRTQVHAASMRGARPVLARGRDVTTGNIYVDVGNPWVPRTNPHGHKMDPNDALPRCALGHWGGDPVELSTPAQRAAAAHEDLGRLHGVLLRLHKYGQRRADPRLPGHEGLVEGEPIARAYGEEALWTTVRYHVRACFNRLTDPNERGVVTVLKEAQATLGVLEREALEAVSPTQEAVLDKFRDRMRRPLQQQRPGPLRFYGKGPADKFCEEVLRLEPNTWRVGVVKDDTQLDESGGLSPRETCASFACTSPLAR
ncbi:hypothetical protein RB597_002876 [Gaeumannomyces tritici]